MLYESTTLGLSAIDSNISEHRYLTRLAGKSQDWRQQCCHLLTTLPVLSGQPHTAPVTLTVTWKTWSVPIILVIASVDILF